MGTTLSSADADLRNCSEPILRVQVQVSLSKSLYPEERDRATLPSSGSEKAERDRHDQEIPRYGTKSRLVLRQSLYALRWHRLPGQGLLTERKGANGQALV